MFTGIVEEVGNIISIKKGQKSSTLSIHGIIVFDDLKPGDSVAVNGVCLTVSKLENKSFTVDIMSETLSRSSLGQLKPGSNVNLERAMPSYGRFGGHIVLGHIDGTGTISDIRRDDNAVWFTIKTTEKIMKYIVEKGSVTVDGISLTVAAIENSNFKVSIIPHTISSTILAQKHTGDTVNLENDMIGKYIEKFLNQTSAKSKPQSNITADFLAKAGF